jgi:rubredoxin
MPPFFVVTRVSGARRPGSQRKITGFSVFPTTSTDLRETRSMKQYQCLVCGFIYDEALGLPDDGIPAGTLWSDVPSGWECPDCGVSKSDFEMVAI